MIHLVLLQTLLPHRDLHKHRAFRSAHKNKLTDIRLAAFPELRSAEQGLSGAGPQPQQQQQQLKTVGSASAKQGCQAGLQAASVPKDFHTAGPSARARTAACGAAQASGQDSLRPYGLPGKPKVTEIAGKKTTLAKLERELLQRGSGGLGGMPDWDSLATHAAPPAQLTRAVALQHQAAPAPADLSSQAREEESKVSWVVPTDPRLRVNPPGEDFAAKALMPCCPW